MLREYWHSGHLRRVRLADLDGNGVSEIYLGGVNNARHAATLVVLDPDSFSGASLEDNPDGQLLDFPPGKEQARLLFPRTCVNQKYESYNGVESLQLEGATILVGVLERFSPQWRPLVFYELGSDLKLKMADFSTTFGAYHAELESTHQLDHRLSDRELNNLNSIRYLQVK